MTILHIWYIIMIVLELAIFLILILVMYVKRLPSMLHCLFMVPSLLVSVNYSFMIFTFVLYHQSTTLSLLILVQSPSDCGKFIIHHSLLFIDTLYLWYLDLWIMYVCINSKSTICTELSMLRHLPASACTWIFTWMITALLSIYILSITTFVFK